jgi:hypothetical protein
LRSWQKPNPEERECDEKWWSCFELNQWIHRSSFLFPRRVDSAIAGPEEATNPAGKVLRLIQDRLSDAEFGKTAANLSNQFAASADRQFQFEKRSQLFIRTHDEPLSVVAMRVTNPDRSPVGIPYRWEENTNRLSWSSNQTTS